MTNNRDVGKGDTPRPLGVNKETFDKNWDEIFKKAEIKPVEIDFGADNDHAAILATIPFGR